MKTEKACGAIIIREGKVLLIQQTQGHWGFPKGHVENDETEEETAIREVKEETNVDIEIDLTRKYQMEYELPNGNNKVVVFFIAKPLSNNIKKQEEEISNIEWVEIEKVEDKLTYENTRELFREAMKDIKK